VKTYIIAANYQDYALYCKENNIDPNEPIFIRDTRNLVGIDPGKSKFIFTKLASSHPLYLHLVELVESIISERRRGYDVHEEVLESNS
jgi:hypothetical protein